MARQEVRMYAEERQQAMAQLITQEGRLSVADLAGNFSVTTETVRRDLSALERIGLVRRVHGGAVPASSLSVIESGLG
jgi:DeoR family fructose operon transcriptional repressor